ncbi:uncharacterized protein BCR38DRAFT_4971 [Pseudomassariella vexata]|uniref:Ribonucleases P/MRP subunit Pop8-like domain-containing protein n=1 Tax=Pseudomassariella vexata TaxID=1141098 RepID=A0A1Y2EIX1_9PEZI|nr:uncharacterized protein BCR38DRAFT_4971 [Pseudomassariella vexata]ORY71186.1 hypothetical protein BCR38DRAFT_4971 [Pseudomassariella vexata]
MADAGDRTMSSIASIAKAQKSRDLVTCTIRAPRFSYVHLENLTQRSEPAALDPIQIRSYCTAALKQFLGITGTSISLDFLKVDGAECWLRLPRDDLSAFSAAITAWQGTYENGVHATLHVKGCSNWLGTLIDRNDEDRLWKG